MSRSLGGVCSEDFNYLGAWVSGGIGGDGKVVSIETEEEVYGVEICLHCGRDFFGEEEGQVVLRGVWWENELFQERPVVSLQEGYREILKMKVQGIFQFQCRLCL